MAKRILRTASGHLYLGEDGFTLTEVMTAMMISIIVMLANLAIFNVANRNFAYSRALTNATNHATDKINWCKTRLVTTQPCLNGTGSIDTSLVNLSFPASGSPCLTGGVVNTAEYPGLEDQPLYLSAGIVNPSYSYTTGPASVVGLTQSDPSPTVIDGVSFNRSWVVSYADPNNDGVFTMKSDVVKVKVTVTWIQNGKSHQVQMATFTTGKPTT
jgi:hypothetical protein